MLIPLIVMIFCAVSGLKDVEIVLKKNDGTSIAISQEGFESCMQQESYDDLLSQLTCMGEHIRFNMLGDDCVCGSVVKRDGRELFVTQNPRVINPFKQGRDYVRFEVTQEFIITALERLIDLCNRGVSDAIGDLSQPDNTRYNISDTVEINDLTALYLRIVRLIRTHTFTDNLVILDQHLFDTAERLSDVMMSEHAKEEPVLYFLKKYIKRVESFLEHIKKQDGIARSGIAVPRLLARPC